MIHFIHRLKKFQSVFQYWSETNGWSKKLTSLLLMFYMTGVEPQRLYTMLKVKQKLYSCSQSIGTGFNYSVLLAELFNDYSLPIGRIPSCSKHRLHSWIDLSVMLVKIILYAVCSVVLINVYPAFSTKSKENSGCSFNPTQRQTTVDNEILGTWEALYRAICLLDIRLLSANCSTVICFLFIWATSVSPKLFGNDREIDTIICVLLANVVGDSLLPKMKGAVKKVPGTVKAYGRVSVGLLLW